MSDTITTPKTDDAPASAAKSDAAARASAEMVDAQGGHVVGRSVTINRPRAELYAYFRDFTKLPTFMENVERIDMLSPTRSRWVVKAPGGRTVEWIAKLTEEQDGEAFAWTSEEGADIANSGRVTFRDAQGQRGTIVTATILYDPPGGGVGKVIAKLFQREPAIQARRDLRRFKMLMETGEVATAARNHRELEEEQA